MKYDERKTKQPRKKRKELYNLPLHQRQKMVAAHLSKELRAKEKKRSLPARKGDSVKVARGRYRGRTGKITRVNLKRAVIFVEGLMLKKQSGKEVQAPIQPSNVILTALVERKKR